MSDQNYKVIEVFGTFSSSMDDAIQGAVQKAAKTGALPTPKCNSSLSDQWLAKAE